MELNLHGDGSGNDYQEVVRTRFKQALVDLLNSFYQVSHISRAEDRGGSLDISCLAELSSAAEIARTAKTEIDNLTRDYAIVYDPKELRINPMHEYVCLIEKDLWSREDVA